MHQVLEALANHSINNSVNFRQGSRDLRPVLQALLRWQLGWAAEVPRQVQLQLRVLCVQPGLAHPGLPPRQPRHAAPRTVQPRPSQGQPAGDWPISCHVTVTLYWPLTGRSSAWPGCWSSTGGWGPSRGSLWTSTYRASHRCSRRWGLYNKWRSTKSIICSSTNYWSSLTSW